jgi:hypothetical protein
MGISERTESHVAGARVMRVRVIKWDAYHYGVVIDYTNDKHTAFPVGTRNQALAEATAIRTGKRKPALLRD